jgi:endonuclease III
MALSVEDLHDGEIPHTKEKLIKLAGVGNKTANVFLIEADGANLMAVDTHVFRVSHRLGLSRWKNCRANRSRTCKKTQRGFTYISSSYGTFWTICL